MTNNNLDWENMLEDTKKSSEKWEEMLAKYPSLKKFEEQEDKNVESHDGREERLLQFVKNHPDLENMKNNPARILEAVDEFASEHEFLINIGPHKGEIVTNLILENKPRVLVELGGYVGYSAILFAVQMRGQSTEARPVHLYSLEKDSTIATIARDLISLAGLQDYITVIDGSADESLRKLKKDGTIENIDFLFIDHVEELYIKDLKVAMEELDLLRANACIVADNVLVPGAPEYKEYVRSHENLRSRSLNGLIIPGEFEDELEISKVLKSSQENGEQGEAEG